MVLLLVVVDQLTKIWALHLDSARHAMSSAKVVGLGLLIHLPERSELYYAVSASIVIALTAVSPISRLVKVLWVAAGISNHGEMILRHGSVDFLAFRLGDRVCVANLADIYLVIGLVVLAISVFRVVRNAKSWTEPVAITGGF